MLLQLPCFPSLSFSHHSLVQTIMLQQGEMIIHVGSLKHSGVDIAAGVRYILVAFLSCDWEKPPGDAPGLPPLSAPDDTSSAKTKK